MVKLPRNMFGAVVGSVIKLCCVLVWTKKKAETHFEVCKLILRLKPAVELNEASTDTK